MVYVIKITVHSIVKIILYLQFIYTILAIYIYIYIYIHIYIYLCYGHIHTKNRNVYDFTHKFFFYNYYSAENLELRTLSSPLPLDRRV